MNKLIVIFVAVFLFGVALYFYSRPQVPDTPDINSNNSSTPLTSNKCGLCGSSAIHNVEGNTCADGYVCKNGTKTSLSYCVLFNESTEICEN